MPRKKSIREQVAEYLVEHPGSSAVEIKAELLWKGISSSKGIESVISHMVSGGIVDVDRSEHKRFRYTLKEEARAVMLVDATRFAVPAELAGPIVPPLVWSMRHLLGHAG